MKYIRTKDGRIYEIINETENSFELCSPFENKMGCSCIMIKRTLGSNEKPTYRLADTIEALCDEFVLTQYFWETAYTYHKVLNGKDDVLIKSVKGRKLDNDYDSNECNVYGAIWTDKGLIYVAKMNDKGVMELL